MILGTVIEQPSKAPRAALACPSRALGHPRSVLECPKAALVCPNLFCPANCAGRGDCIYRPKGTISTSEPLASCVCDSSWDTSSGCFNTAPSYPENYGYENSSNPYQANKAIFLLIMGSLMAGLTAIFVVVRQWKARQNLFM